MNLRNNDGKSGYSIASFILALAPLAILLIGFLFCLIVSGGQTSDNDMGAVWWLFIFLLWILIPTTLITNILAIVFGVIGLRRKRTMFAWSGIAIVVLEALVIVLISGIIAVANFPAINAKTQEIKRQQETIQNYRRAL